MRIYGVDFTCAPRKAKPITIAAGLLRRNSLFLEKVEHADSFSRFEAFLARQGPWIGGFDLPFSLPAELVRDLGWPSEWKALVGHCSKLDRLQLRAARRRAAFPRPVPSPPHV